VLHRSDLLGELSRMKRTIAVSGTHGKTTTASMVALALAFPEGAHEPFDFSTFWPVPLVTLAFAYVLPRDERALRIGAVVYALATVAFKLVATPMGGNAVRLGGMFGAGLLLCVFAGRLPRSRPRRVLIGVLLAAFVVWQWSPAIRDTKKALEDPATRASYYKPLLDELGRVTRGREPTRIEIPFTRAHWEAAEVARRYPLARGWERQVDVKRNRLFYDHKPLTAWRYRAWLDDNAVRYVALADAPLDYSAAKEARLVRAGLPYLREVWHDAHWRVFAVTDARPLATGAATVTALGSERIRLRARRTGMVDLRVRFTPYWNIAVGRGCVEAGPRGWTRIRVDRTGPLVLSTKFSLGRVGADSPRCSKGVAPPAAGS
jgi:hypothetical protein